MYGYTYYSIATLRADHHDYLISKCNVYNFNKSMMLLSLYNDSNTGVTACDLRTHKKAALITVIMGIRTIDVVHK